MYSSTQTTHYRRWGIPLSAAVLMAIGVVIVALIGPRYLWNAEVKSLTASDETTAQTLPVSSRGIAQLNAGHTIVLAGTTRNASTARIVLRHDGTTARSLAVLPSIRIREDRLTSVRLRTASLKPGDYTAAVYLDGNDTVDGSVDFQVR